MFDWDRFESGKIAVEMNNVSDVYGFLEMAQNQGFGISASADAYVSVMQNGYKYFWLNHFGEIGVTDSVYKFDYVIKFSDVVSNNFPSKDSLMEFLNGE